MQNFGNVANTPLGAINVTVFDANRPPYIISLNNMGKNVISFGRAEDNDIVLSSHLVSRKHGTFVFSNNRWYIQDGASTNGLTYNNATIKWKEIGDGDFIRIDDCVETVENGVLFVVSSPASTNKWNFLQTAGKNVITIGREPGCAIVLPHVTVSKCHAIITLENGRYFIKDNNSTNGVVVNGVKISGKVMLHEKDVITITNAKIIFTAALISYCYYRSGISVDASNVVITRGKGNKRFVTCDHVDLNIKPGELVSIIGGSGAGKSTILNCMCGYLKPAAGDVYINGINLYQNFDSLKKLIGYVPQSDIVYDNLTLYDMLLYTANLRLPKDISPAEREAAINRAIQTVELADKRNSLIKALSGGQRKRASIAVELLSDPNLLFLDEPASGLDPGTERNLMHSLRNMANSGKTVILVTHSTLQLKMCDKIVFMGKGGRLCFCGSYDEALRFFGVSDIVDVYNMITDHSPEWSAKYRQSAVPAGVPRQVNATSAKLKTDRVAQLGVLCKRYIKLVLNDRQRIMLLLFQAPILALLISFVANGKQFDQYEMTKSLLFALSCSAFWIGMLNAIQEICKERSILKREYMTGLSLTSYILSKIVVLGVLCFIQSILVTGVFAALVGLPDSGIILPAFLELLMTIFLTAVSSAAMGLFVSSLFTNADRAMTVAPILLMPQILFSGLIFSLSGATEIISWFAVCRWSMEGLGTTANLNDLPLKLQQQGLPIEHKVEDFFEFSAGHMLESWFILILFTAVFLGLSRMVLNKIGKE